MLYDDDGWWLCWRDLHGPPGLKPGVNMLKAAGLPPESFARLINRGASTQLLFEKRSNLLRGPHFSFFVWKQHWSCGMRMAHV